VKWLGSLCLFGFGIRVCGAEHWGSFLAQHHCLPDRSGNLNSFTGLFEQRDLAITTDFRDVLGELVRVHLGQKVEQVFPGHKPGEALGLI
jgi:hypothetical protein